MNSALERKTGIALPNETNGKILYNYPIEKVTTVFGQGTTVSMMQMIQAASAIASDGTMKNLMSFQVSKIRIQVKKQTLKQKLLVNPSVQKQPRKPVTN